MKIEANIIPIYDVPEHAFRNSLINEVTIPEGVETIGKRAFKNCRELGKVTLPATLKTISTGAFEGCTSLRSIEIPEGVETIQKNAFRGCISLWKVNIPSSIKHIGSNAFGDTALYEVKIPLVGADIANDAFPKDNAFHYSDETPIVMVEAARDKDIKALIISEGVTKIYDGSFQDWESLNTIILPSTIRYIGENVFAQKLYHYTVISKIKHPDHIIELGDNSLYLADCFLDEDTGKSVPIKRTFIRELIVPKGSAEAYKSLEHLSFCCIREADI